MDIWITRTFILKSDILKIQVLSMKLMDMVVAILAIYPAAGIRRMIFIQIIGDTPTL